MENVPEVTALETITQKNPHVQIANQDTPRTIPTVKHTSTMQGKSTTKETFPFRDTYKIDLSSIPVMTNKNSITALQLNPTGLSNAKQLLLNKYLEDQKPDFVALNETKKQIPENFFTNYRTFSRCIGQNQRGVSLSVPKDTSCFEIKELENKKFDSIWCAVQYHKQPILVATAYIPPGEVNIMEEFIITFESAIDFAKANNMKGVLFVGDLNARSTLWGDSLTNNSGSTLERYIENKLVNILNNGENTFYAVNGSSVIDLCMTTDQLANWKSTFYTDTEAELLTGSPSHGHVPLKCYLPSFSSTEKVTAFKIGVD